MACSSYKISYKKYKYEKKDWKIETKKPDRGISTMMYTVKNQINEDVLITDMTFLMNRRKIKD